MHGLDLFGLSKFLHRRGDKGRAQVACAQAVDVGLPVEFHSRAQYDLALMAKRKGEHQRAAELWHEILADSGDAIHACEQLAIHYEKRVKDYERALEFAHRARRLLRTQANQREHIRAERICAPRRFVGETNQAAGSAINKAYRRATGVGRCQRTVSTD